MMGQRDRTGASSKTPKRSSGANQRSGLLLNSSDGIGGSSSSCHSSESASETAYLHQKAPKQQAQVQYVSSDGSVYTFAANPHTNNNNNNQQQQQLAQATRNDNAQAQQRQQKQQKHGHSSYLNHQSDVVQSDESPNSSSTNLELPAIQKQLQNEQRQQQHRRLQHQVHQQLQRIYGNTDRQPLDPQAAGEARQFLFKKHSKQTPSAREHQQPQVFRSGVMKNSHMIMMGSQQKAQHHQQYQQQEQTYDSLGSASLSKHQLNEGFYTLEQPQATNHARHHQQASISAIPEECDDDDDELLITEPNSVAPAKRAAIDRKNQLEDLHYATATAAALLSATASAAAAFAATEKQFDRADDVRCNPLQDHHEPNHLINSIYSETYQEVRKQRGHDDGHPNAVARYKQQQQQQQHQHQHHHQQHYQQQRNLQRGPIYADAIDPTLNFIGANERRLAHLNPAAAVSSSAIYSPIARANAGQSQVYSVLPSNYYAHYQQPGSTVPSGNFVTRPTPPQPPLRRLNRRLQVAQISNPVDLLRQHQHQQRMLHQRAQLHQQAPGVVPAIAMQQHHHQPHPTQQPPPAQVPALAIVHHGKGASAKADLIGRMLVNNLIAAQQVARANAEAASGAQYMVPPVTGLPVDRGRELANKLANQHGFACGVLGGDKIYRAPAPVFSVTAGMAPSDTSGHSNVPLVLDRELKPVGFIERICRIDLTLFWWSLLIVSFLFMGAMITISRYIF